VLYPWCVVEYTKSKGDEIILKIEKYKKEHMGLYPLSLRQLELEQAGTDCSYSYKGRTFYYDCFQDIGGEYSISFYYSGKHYSYESLTKSWAEGERVEEINNLRHKMYKIIISPDHYKKWKNNVGKSFKAPMIKKAVIGLNKGKSRLISTAVYGRTIFWRTTR